MDENEAYHYVQCGLPNVWLLNGYNIVHGRNGEGVSIRDIDGLHRCLARSLCDKPEALTGAEFRFLRRELDFSQKMMGELLGRGARQIRNMETGEDRIKEPYNHLVRLIYMESIDPKSSYIDLFNRLRSLDIEWHNELRMTKHRDWSTQYAA